MKNLHQSPMVEQKVVAILVRIRKHVVRIFLVRQLRENEVYLQDHSAVSQCMDKFLLSYKLSLLDMNNQRYGTSRITVPVPKRGNGASGQKGYASN